MSLQMREEDIQVFKEAAVHTGSWIMLRQTNVQSLKFMGRADCLPKPLVCKFKTASRDSKSYHTGGLVVSYEIHTDCFDEPKEAHKEWVKYAKKYQLHLHQRPRHKPGKGFGIDLDKTSPRHGCLTYDGYYLYGDYDLFDIVRVGDERRNLGLVGEQNGEITVTGINYKAVNNYINMSLGIDMIQHPGSALFKNKFDNIYVFSPEGNFEFWPKQKAEEEYAKWIRPVYSAIKQKDPVPPPPVNPKGPSLRLV
ncbi:hypothetical protein [Dyadobacter alkalitolerans]|uniref:hypothetical protein n=1 Tax=Dyadobacter alkalitolerans TaxID=492736 RepID=UPI0012F85A0C|nr:hypothetical protein [Dyadobacter alkalitolerans]